MNGAAAAAAERATALRTLVDKVLAGTRSCTLCLLLCTWPPCLVTSLLSPRTRKCQAAWPLLAPSQGARARKKAALTALLHGLAALGVSRRQSAVPPVERSAQSWFRQVCGRPSAHPHTCCNMARRFDGHTVDGTRSQRNGELLHSLQRSQVCLLVCAVLSGVAHSDVDSEVWHSTMPIVLESCCGVVDCAKLGASDPAAGGWQ